MEKRNYIRCKLIAKEIFTTDNVLGDDRLFNRWFSSLPDETNLFRVLQREGHCAIKDLHELTSSEHGQLWREYRLVPCEYWYTAPIEVSPRGLKAGGN